MDTEYVDKSKEIFRRHLFQGFNALNDLDDETMISILKVVGLEFGKAEGSFKVAPGKRKIEQLIGFEIDSSALNKAHDEVKSLHNSFLQQQTENPKVEEPATEASAMDEKIKEKSERKHKPKMPDSTKTVPQIETVEEKPKSESEFSTKRFEKNHRNWKGNELWKASGDNFRGFDVEEDADDDDYLSAWLECLKLGIPWGGRGAGGRGVHRVTGESKDILVYNVTVTKGKSDLIENAVLKLNYGTRYGLIGLNGSGKSTLIKRIATGRLPGFPPFIKVQHVQQELKLVAGMELAELTPVEFVLRFDSRRNRLMKEEEETLEQLEKDQSVEMNQRLSDIYAEMEQIDAYNAEGRAEEILRKMGFTKRHLENKLHELSGGWKMKAALAGALLTSPDVLLLDEPTNHLDIYAVRTLEAFLKDKSNFAGTVLVVTHDRTFLNAVCEEIIVLKNKSLNYFASTYDDFMEMKKQKKLMQQRKSEAIDKKKSGLKSFIDSNTSKSSDQKKQKMIKSKKKKLERLDRIGFGTTTGHRFKEQVDNSPHAYREYVPQAIDLEDKPIKLSFTECSDSFGPLSPLLSLENVSVSLVAPREFLLFDGFSSQILSSSKIGFVGKNGCGKSTLAKIIADVAQAHVSLVGKLTRDPKLKIGYFSQDRVPLLPHDKTACELLMERCRRLKEENFQDIVYLDTIDKARQYLGGFGVKKDVGIRLMETLSGGQKSRVVFALECLSKPNLLVLDEPSNHLDIESIQALGEAIKAYKGAVLLVSHDRSLLSDVCNELWVLDEKQKKIRSFKQLETETTQDFVTRVL